MAATKKLLHHLTPLFDFSPPSTSNTGLHLPKYHLSLSLTLVHHCTVALNFQRWTLCWIHPPKHYIKDSGRLCFSFSAAQARRKSLWTVSRPSAALCNWVDLEVDLLGWSCVCLSVCLSVCARMWIHACLFGAAYEAVTFLSGHLTHFLEVSPVLFEHSCS